MMRLQRLNARGLHRGVREPEPSTKSTRATEKQRGGHVPACHRKRQQPRCQQRQPGYARDTAPRPVGEPPAHRRKGEHRDGHRRYREPDLAVRPAGAFREKPRHRAQRPVGGEVAESRGRGCRRERPHREEARLEHRVFLAQLVANEGERQCRERDGSRGNGPPRRVARVEKPGRGSEQQAQRDRAGRVESTMRLTGEPSRHRVGMRSFAAKEPRAEVPEPPPDLPPLQPEGPPEEEPEPDEVPEPPREPEEEPVPRRAAATAAPTERAPAASPSEEHSRHSGWKAAGGSTWWRWPLRKHPGDRAARDPSALRPPPPPQSTPHASGLRAVASRPGCRHTSLDSGRADRLPAAAGERGCRRNVAGQRDVRVDRRATPKPWGPLGGPTVAIRRCRLLPAAPDHPDDDPLERRARLWRDGRGKRPRPGRRLGRPAGVPRRALRPPPN